MFLKLLKHEWKHSFPVLAVLSLLVLGLGCLAAADLQILVQYGDVLSAENSPYTMVLFGLITLLVFLLLSMLFYVWSSQLLLKFRFYKRKFTLEGYMLFTAPAGPHAIFLSALVNMAFWFIVSVAAVAGAIYIALAYGLSAENWASTRLMEWVPMALRAGQELYARITGSQDLVPYLWVWLAVGALYHMILPMSAIVIGASVARKHKLLAAFGMYWLIALLLGAANIMLGSLIVLDALTLSVDMTAIMLKRLMLMQTAIRAAVILGGYALSTYLLRRKLRLPEN